MPQDLLAPDHGSFATHLIADALPGTAETLLIDHYMTDSGSAGTHVFRVYLGTPAHHHEQSDEHLFVLRGRGTFWMGDESSVAEFGPGHFLVFKKNTVHALPDILEEPLIFVSIDSPRRDPEDIIFEPPEGGDPSAFISQNRA